MELNKIFYINEYRQAYNFAQANDYTIKEIEADVNGKRYQIVEKPQPTVYEVAQRDHYVLKQWFDTIYAYQEQKFRRLMALNKTDDDGVSAAEKLNALYLEAEEKRKQIQELEKEIKKLEELRYNLYNLYYRNTMLQGI